MRRAKCPILAGVYLKQAQLSPASRASAREITTGAIYATGADYARREEIAAMLAGAVYFAHASLHYHYHLFCRRLLIACSKSRAFPPILITLVAYEGCQADGDSAMRRHVTTGWSRPRFTARRRIDIIYGPHAGRHTPRRRRGLLTGDFGGRFLDAPLFIAGITAHAAFTQLLGTQVSLPRPLASARPRDIIDIPAPARACGAGNTLSERASFSAERMVRRAAAF